MSIFTGKNTGYPLKDFLADYSGILKVLGEKETVDPGEANYPRTIPLLLDIIQPNNYDYIYQEYKFFQDKYGALREFYDRLLKFEAIFSFINLNYSKLTKMNLMSGNEVYPDFLNFLLNCRLDNKYNIPHSALLKYKVIFLLIIPD